MSKREALRDRSHRLSMKTTLLPRHRVASRTADTSGTIGLLLLLGSCFVPLHAAFVVAPAVHQLGQRSPLPVHATVGPLISLTTLGGSSVRSQRCAASIQDDAGGVSNAMVSSSWAIMKSMRVCALLLSSFAAVRWIAVGLDGAWQGSQTLYAVQRFSQTGFFEAFSLVSLSEIGDKSFFMAGLLALKTSRVASFVGSFGALTAMTLVSVGIGRAVHAVQLSGPWRGLPLDVLAAVMAFAYFGITTLKEGAVADDTADEELAEAEASVSTTGAVSQSSTWSQIWKTFGLIFAAEFGDRSFLATVGLAAAQNPLSVAWGATAAHALTTIIAIWGSSYVAQYVSEKVMNYVGGALFLLFAITTAMGIS